jgi:hypothetical protein
MVEFESSYCLSDFKRKIHIQKLVQVKQERSTAQIRRKYGVSMIRILKVENKLKGRDWRLEVGEK